MKQHVLKGLTMLVLGGLASSCSHDEVDYSSIVDGKLKAYQEVFVDAFGKIDPNQNWGFKSVPATVTANSNGARMTRGHNANANLWATYGYDVPDPLTDAQKDKVRRWFQQHQNPEGVAVNYTTFFVQDVYKGGTNVDEESQTTEQYTAANGDVFYGSDQMDWLTAGSDNDHINNYNNAQCSSNNNVWDGKSYVDGYTPTGNMEVDVNYAKQHTDEIMLMVNSKTDCFGFANSRQGKLQYNDQYVIIPGDLIQRWDSSTEVNFETADVSGMWFVGFDYEADLDHGWTSIDNSNGYLVTEVEEGYEGAFQVPNEGPYKGKWVIDGAADGYYSDWIVRITPGLLKGEITIPIDQSEESEDRIKVETTVEQYESMELIEQGRVFCEDLGQISTNDLDFNDVVFDAYVYKVTPSEVTIVKEDGEDVSRNTVEGTPTYKTTIVLLAAGGTLQLSLAGVEVHNALGKNYTNTIVNTIVDDGSSYGNPWSTYNPMVLGTDFSYESIVEIPIIVKYGNGEVLELTAEQGFAPHKILVPIGTKWVKERVDIATAYTDFHNYVNTSRNFWDGNIETSKIYYHPKDNYAEREVDSTPIRTKMSGPTVSWRSNGTKTTGGYQGETVLSRRSR